MSSFELILVTWIVQFHVSFLAIPSTCDSGGSNKHFTWLPKYCCNPDIFLINQFLLQHCWLQKHLKKEDIWWWYPQLKTETGIGLQVTNNCQEFKLQHSWLTSHTNKNYLFCEYNWTLITFFFFLQLSGLPSLLPLFLWILISQCRCT